MCFISQPPTQPAAPPPPPPAPPQLEQSTPQSVMSEATDGMNARAMGFTNYKISRRNGWFGANNPMKISQNTNKTTY